MYRVRYQGSCTVVSEIPWLGIGSRSAYAGPGSAIRLAHFGTLRDHGISANNPPTSATVGTGTMAATSANNPRVGVAAVIRNQKGELLFGKRLSSHGRGMWWLLTMTLGSL